MLRVFYVIFMNIFRAPYYIPGMNYVAGHPECFTRMQCYRIVQRVINIIIKTGRIHTSCYGLHNLPGDGGYIMYPNHQGKYDALGIIHTHKQPCGFVIDEKKAGTILVKQVVKLVHGIGMNLSDVKQSMGVIIEVGKRVKSGERFIIFPEGGYTNNHNQLREFKPGCFKSAMIAKCPVVPVAVIDSYKVFEGMSLGRVYTQVHYLEPIYYEDYKELNTRELSQLVKERISQAVHKYK